MIFVGFIATVIALTLATGGIKKSAGRSQKEMLVASNNALFAFKILMSQG